MDVHLGFGRLNALSQLKLLSQQAEEPPRTWRDILEDIYRKPFIELLKAAKLNPLSTLPPLATSCMVVTIVAGFAAYHVFGLVENTELICMSAHLVFSPRFLWQGTSVLHASIPCHDLH